MFSPSLSSTLIIFPSTDSRDPRAPAREWGERQGKRERERERRNAKDEARKEKKLIRKMEGRLSLLTRFLAAAAAASLLESRSAPPFLSSLTLPCRLLFCSPALVRLMKSTQVVCLLLSFFLSLLTLLRPLVACHASPVTAPLTFARRIHSSELTRREGERAAEHLLPTHSNSHLEWKGEREAAIAGTSEGGRNKVDEEDDEGDGLCKIGDKKRVEFARENERICRLLSFQTRESQDKTE